MNFFTRCVELQKNYLAVDKASSSSTIKNDLLAKLVSIYFRYGQDALPTNKTLCVYYGDISNDVEVIKDTLSQILFNLGYDDFDFDDRHCEFNQSLELIIRK